VIRCGLNREIDNPVALSRDNDENKISKCVSLSRTSKLLHANGIDGNVCLSHNIIAKNVKCMLELHKV